METQKEVQKRWKHGQNVHWLSYLDFDLLTKEISKNFGIYAQTIQCVCKQFVDSRNLRKKCPKFRRSSSPNRSLGWIPFQKGSRQISSDSITYLGKTYRFFGANKLILPSTAKGGHFFEDRQGKWYVSFYVERKEDNDHGDKEIGLDLGLKDLVTTSDGIKYENPKFYYKLEEKLKTACRYRNWQMVRAIHAKIKNQRKDYLHKLSNKLVRESKLIVVGNAKANNIKRRGIQKAAQDASWSGLRKMLCYKASRHGVKYLETNEAFTTQTCSHCGQRPEGRPKGIAGLGIREWVCSLCGTSHDRDVNAAKNILALGRGAAPPGGGSLADGVI